MAQLPTGTWTQKVAILRDEWIDMHQRLETPELAARKAHHHTIQSAIIALQRQVPADELDRTLFSVYAGQEVVRPRIFLAAVMARPTLAHHVRHLHFDPWTSAAAAKRAVQRHGEPSERVYGTVEEEYKQQLGKLVENLECLPFLENRTEIFRDLRQGCIDTVLAMIVLVCPRVTSATLLPPDSLEETIFVEVVHTLLI